MTLMFPKPTKKDRPKRRPKRKNARKALKASCFRAWGEIVRSKGGCTFRGIPLKPGAAPHECKGPLQAMHGIPRRYLGTAFEVWNGYPGCAAAHMYFTQREAEWQLLLRRWWGNADYESRWAVALRISDLAESDFEKTLSALRRKSGATGGGKNGNGTAGPEGGVATTGTARPCRGRPSAGSVSTGAGGPTAKRSTGSPGRGSSGNSRPKAGSAPSAARRSGARATSITITPAAPGGSSAGAAVSGESCAPTATAG